MGKASHLSDISGEVLVVEDTPASLKLITDTLAGQGYRVRPANNGEIALESAFAKAPDLVLLDIRMPGIDGFEVIRRLKEDERTKHVPVIFLSASVDIDSHLRGFEMGAVDFIMKPFQREELLARVRSHLELHYLREKMEDEISLRTEELVRALREMIEATAMIIGARDPYTAGHQRRVSQLAVAIAEKMGLAANIVEGVKHGAMIHDMGKIQVPAEMLSKPAKLSDTEFELVKQHTAVGYEVLRSIHFPWPVADIAYQHHERLDGSGYPRGLKGDEICLEARIVAVADVVEAMASHRPYRPAFGVEAALEEIRNNSGSLYDKNVVDACLKVFAEGFTLPSENNF